MFSDTEYERRLAGLRETMRDRGLAACLFTRLHSIIVGL